MKKRQKGFSIVLVLLIIAILVAVAYLVMNFIRKDYGVNTLDVQIPSATPY